MYESLRILKGNNCLIWHHWLCTQSVSCFWIVLEAQGYERLMKAKKHSTSAVATPASESIDKFDWSRAWFVIASVNDFTE